MNKWNKEAVRNRAENAIADLYHNATPSYPYCESESEFANFESWFSSAAEFEIEYMQGGGANGNHSECHIMLSRTAANRLTSESARLYYVRKGMRAMRLERAKFAPWERITEYGRLYQYGHGGRTLAPDDFVKQGGGSQFGMLADFDDLPIADVVEIIQIVESFNSYCAAWCESVPAMWKESREEMESDYMESAYAQ